MSGLEIINVPLKLFYKNFEGRIVFLKNCLLKKEREINTIDIEYILIPVIILNS